MKQLVLFFFFITSCLYAYPKNPTKDHPPVTVKLPTSPGKIHLVPTIDPRKGTGSAKKNTSSSEQKKSLVSVSTQPQSGSTIAPLPTPKTITGGKLIGPDPIRFTMRSSKNPVNAGEEFEITLTAELLPILPSQLFFFDQQKTFRLKLLLPKGAQQTGGTYYDLIGETLKPEGLNLITYTWRGTITSGDSSGCFRLLREVSSASDQALFIEKGQLCIQVGAPALKDSVAVQPKADVSASKARTSACSGPRVSWAGNSSTTSLSWLAEDTPGFTSSDAPATLQAQTCPGTVNWYKRQADNTGLLVASGSSYTYVTHNYIAAQNVTYRYYATCVCVDGESAPSADFPITINRKTITLTPTSTTACNAQLLRTPLTVSGCPAGSTIKFYNSVAYSWTMVSTGDNSVYNAYGGVQEDTYQASCIFWGVEGPRSSSATITGNCSSTCTYANGDFTITAAATAVCTDHTTSLTVNGCNGTVSWANGINPNAVGPGTYTAYCTASCSQTSKQITIGTSSYANGDFTITAAATAVCTDHTTSLTVNGCNGTVSWANGINPNAVGPGTYTAYCTASCSQTSKQITIGTLIKPTAPTIHQTDHNTITSLSICPNNSVSLWAENCSNGVNWYKDGNYSTTVGEGNPFNSGNLTSGATFTARCKDTNGCGDSGNSNIFTLTVNAKPAATPQVSTNNGVSFSSLSAYTVCEGSSVTLGMDNWPVPAGYTQRWSGPNSSTGPLNTNWVLSGITPAQGGYYTYKVTDANSCTNTAQVLLWVLAKPAATPLVSFNNGTSFNSLNSYTVCEGSSVTLGMDNWPVPAGYTQRWSGPNSSTGPLNTNWVLSGITPAQGGYYTYKVTDANSCTNTAQVLLWVLAKPAATPQVSTNNGVSFSSLSAYTVCEGSSVTLGMDNWPVPAGYTQRWSGPNSSTGPLNTNWVLSGITPAQGGYYTYKVTDANSCTNTAQVLLWVLAKPAATPLVSFNNGTSFNSLNSYTVCEGSSVTLGMDNWPVPAGYTQRWSGPNSSTGPLNTNWVLPGITPAQGGYYTYKVTDANSCTNTAQVLLWVLAKPAATPLVSFNNGTSFNSLNSYTVCEGSSVTLGMDNWPVPAGYTQRWSGPNSSTGPLNTNWVLSGITPAQGGYYTYKVTDANSCTNTAQVLLWVLAKPAATPLVSFNNGTSFNSLNSYTVCEGSSVTLGMDNWPVPAGYTQRWSGPNSSTGPLNTNWVLPGITPAQGGYYTYKVTDANSCTNTAQVLLWVLAKPAATPLVSFNNGTSFNSLNSYTVCEGSSVTLGMDNWPVPAGYTQRWSGPNSSTGPLNTNWVLSGITPAQGGYYTYKVTDANSCTNTAQVLLWVLAKPAATPLVSFNNGTSFNSLNSYTVCEGSSVTLGMDNWPVPAGYTQRWSGPNSSTGPLNTNWVLSGITPAQGGYYTYKVTDANSCTNTAQVLLWVLAKPAATPLVSFNNGTSFNSLNSYTVCEGSSVTLGMDNWPVPAGYTQRWSGPNSSTGPLNTNWVLPGITPAQGGYYTYKVTDANSCTNTAQVLLWVLAKPAATPQVSTNNGVSFSSLSAYTVCEGSSVTLGMDNWPVPAGYTQRWSGPNSSTGPLNTNWVLSGITPAQGGYYTYKVTDANSCTNTAQVLLWVLAKPAATPLVSFNNGTSFNSLNSYTVCEGSSVTLGMDNWPVPAGYTQRWSGPNSSTGPLNTNWVLSGITPAQGGYYTYKVTDANSCTNTAQVLLWVLAKPAATPLVSFNNGTSFNSLNSYTVCEGSSVTLGMDNWPVPAGYTQRWSGPNSSTGPLNTNWVLSGITPAQGGYYTYKVTDANSCTNTSQVTLTVKPAPAIPLVSLTYPTNYYTASSYTACQGQKVSFGMNPWPIPQGNYQGWSGPAGTSLNGNLDIESVQPAQSGTYTYSVTTTTGCTNAVSVSLVVTPSFTPTLTARVAGTASSQSLTLTASGCPAGSTVQWSGPNNTTATGSSWLIASFTQTNTYSAKCQSSTTCPSTAQITVTYLVPSTPIVRTTATQVCAGQSVTLTADGCQAGTTVLWAGGQTGQSLVLTPTATATYRAYCVAGEVVGDPSTQLGVTVLSSFITTISGSQTYTVGETISLTAVSSASGSVTYRWSGPNAFSSTAQNPTLPNATTAMSGSYSVIVTNTTGCTASASYALSVVASICSCQDCDAPEWQTDVIAVGNANTGTTYNSVVVDTYLSPTQSVGGTTERSQQIAYLDGFGRPLQMIQTGASPTGKDVVAPVVYDGFGRVTKNYLPYTDAAGGSFKNNAITAQAGFYSGLKGDAAAYAETLLDASPLQRITQQGSIGTAWQPNAADANKTGVIKANYRISSETTIPKLVFAYSGTTWTLSRYAAKQLFVNETKDANNNTVVAFTDILGQTVCKKVYNGTDVLTTYYAYDDFGRLCLTFPPKAAQKLESQADGTIDFTTADAFKDQIYWYVYDARGRVVEKKTSDATIEEMVYNLHDQVVLYRNGLHRKQNQWLYSKYDELGRMASKGVYSSANSRTVEQTNVNNSFSPAPVFGDLAYPTTGLTELSRSYYDDYAFTPKKSPDQPTEFGLGTLATEAGPVNLIGKLTGTQETVLKASGATATAKTTLLTTYYYDQYGRQVQTRQENHLSGEDLSSVRLDFAGRVLETKLTTSAYSKTTNVWTRNTYTRNNQLKMTCQRINDGNKEPVGRYSYNELGEMTEKWQGCKLQVITYQTDIRGRLTGINSSDPVQLKANKQFFGLKLEYSLDDNISAQEWGSVPNLRAGATLPAKRRYDYTYDLIGRLKGASYSGGTEENFSVSGINYDLNGNLLSMNRRVKTPSLIDSPNEDNLSYAYAPNSNQLRNVIDNGRATPDSPKKAHYFNDRNQTADDGIRTGFTAADDYAYDEAGNLVRDLNRDIRSIDYNVLGLPETITFGNQTKIYYLYTGGGDKLQKQGAYLPTNQAGQYAQKQIDYAGGLVYTEQAISFIPTAEGRALPPLSGATTTDYRYEYQQTDQLGNLRSACRCGEKFDANGNLVPTTGGEDPRTVVQENHFDPWGLNLADIETQPGSNTDLWQFTGQERDYQAYTEFKLRQYDATLGRFTSVDPMADAFSNISPFNYADNSPIANIDLYGLQKVPISAIAQAEADGLGIFLNGGPVMYNVAPGVGLSLTGQALTGQTLAASTAVNLLRPIMQIGLPTLINRSPSFVGSSSGGSPAQTALTNEQYGQMRYWEEFGSGVGNGNLQSILSPVTDIFASKYRADLYNTAYGYDFFRSVGIRFKGTAKAQLALGAASIIKGSVAAIIAEGGMGGIEVTEASIAKALESSTMKTLQGEVSLPMVKRYVKMLENGSVPPPIKVADGVIIEGNHRYVAGRLFGVEPPTVPGAMSPSQIYRIKPIQQTKVNPLDLGGY